MSRIGTKKPPIKNAYYAPQEHVTSMRSQEKNEYFKAKSTSGVNQVKDDFMSSQIGKE